MEVIFEDHIAVHTEPLSSLQKSKGVEKHLYKIRLSEYRKPVHDRACYKVRKVVMVYFISCSCQELLLLFFSDAERRLSRSHAGAWERGDIKLGEVFLLE